MSLVCVVTALPTWRAWAAWSGGPLAALALACSGESVHESIYMVVNVMDVRRSDAVIIVAHCSTETARAADSTAGRGSRFEEMFDVAARWRGHRPALYRLTPPIQQGNPSRIRCSSHGSIAKSHEDPRAASTFVVSQAARTGNDDVPRQPQKHEKEPWGPRRPVGCLGPSAR